MHNRYNKVPTPLARRAVEIDITSVPAALLIKTGTKIVAPNIANTC